MSHKSAVYVTVSHRLFFVLNSVFIVHGTKPSSRSVDSVVRYDFIFIFLHKSVRTFCTAEVKIHLCGFYLGLLLSIFNLM